MSLSNINWLYGLGLLFLGAAIYMAENHHQKRHQTLAGALLVLAALTGSIAMWGK